MSFTMNVTVPRITAAQKETFEAEFPGLTKLSNIPVVETEEQAVKAGSDLAALSLVKYEYVADVNSIAETSTGWKIEFRIAGD